MPYLVDGHNLIPHVGGIRLSDLDDEMALINRLVGFAARRRTAVEVYFDRGRPGSRPREQYGRVRVHFVPGGTTADRAIRGRLDALGREAKNWRVVSSDREVIREAQAHRAGVIRAPDFARQLNPTRAGKPDRDRAQPEPELSPEEIQYWLDQFGEG